jgi:hypothetical protein
VSAGLKLALTPQPALAPLSSLAIGLTKLIAKRNRNMPVQDVYLGLDFGGAPTGARLALGSYIQKRGDGLIGDLIHNPVKSSTRPTNSFHPITLSWASAGQHDDAGDRKVSGDCYNERCHFRPTALRVSVIGRPRPSSQACAPLRSPRLWSDSYKHPDPAISPRPLRPWSEQSCHRRFSRHGGSPV